MANGERKVTVQDQAGSYSFPTSLSVEEIRKALQSISGQAWLGQAAVCEERDGSLSFKRPAAAPKGSL